MSGEPASGAWTSGDQCSGDADACVVCARCGAVAQGVPPTWTFSVEGGSRRHYCVDCARVHLRAIEGRLDSAWW
ncbi:hypothetical protein [Streptomyces sp. NPDC058657]|uniref:hypothetical protein n=1 Tax=unclassified Streptomyces TaxID=2593676 RepID=UPI0036497F29